MFSFEIAEEEANSIEDKASMHAQKMKAEEKWRAAIGVPRNFDERTKELLSIVKDAKWKASVNNIAKRVKCYLAAINKRINLFNHLIEVLAHQKEQTGYLVDTYMWDQAAENFKEISVAKDMQPLEAMVDFEEARKASAVVDALEVSWREIAFKNLDTAREDLKKHLNSITRRQYLYSTIKATLNPWLTHEIPSGDFKQLISNLSPHEIVNLRDGIHLKRGSEDYMALAGIHKKEMARLDADRKALSYIGKPLSEGANFLFSELGINQVRMSRLFKNIEDGLANAEDGTEIKLQLLEVGFEVEYELEQIEETPFIAFNMFALVIEEVNWLSAYKKWASGGRKKGCGEICLGTYSIAECVVYFPLDDVDSMDVDGSIFEDFGQEFTNLRDWYTSKCIYTFSFSSDGKVRQRRFAETAGGRSTFALESGTSYDPVQHPISLENPIIEW